MAEVRWPVKRCGFVTPPYAVGLLIPCTTAMMNAYANVMVAVAIIAGEGGGVPSWQDHSLRLRHEVPSSVFHLVPKAGHIPHRSAPGRAIAVIDWASAAARDGVAVQAGLFALG